MNRILRSIALAGAACGLALSVGLAPAPAHGDVVLAFDPQYGVITQTVPPAEPETLTVQVNVDASAVDLRGFSFVLEFDPTYVFPVSVTSGALLSGVPCGNFFNWLNPTAIGDSIAVDGAGLGCSMTGPGTLVEMRFVGVPGNYGVSPLAWRDARLRDSLNEPLASICVDGTITHQPLIISVSASTWARLKTLYR